MNFTARALVTCTVCGEQRWVTGPGAEGAGPELDHTDLRHCLRHLRRRVERLDREADR